MDEEFIRLVELLQGKVELLDDRGSVVTRKLLVRLTNNIEDDIVRTLH